MNQADPGGVPEALRRFQQALGGLGRIGGPHREEGRIDLYRWEISSRSDVTCLRDLLAPWLGQVKLDQFAETLTAPASRSDVPNGGDEWRAWAAGFYDGEGSVYPRPHRSHQGQVVAEMRITQGSASEMPEVLKRFAAVVHCGRLYGPYKQRHANLAVYRWNLSNRDAIESTLGGLWPWLGPVKRAQATAVLDVLRSQPVLPRGRPEWGNRKTHCIHGHEYATNRLRAYLPRGVGVEPRDSEQCLQCARDQARARREQKKRPPADDDRRSLSEQTLRYLLK